MFCPKAQHVFFENDGRYVNSPDSADYLRIVSEPDSGSTLYNVKEYYRSQKLKSVGKSSKIDPPLYEGQYTEFHETGKRKMIATYKQGKIIGDEYDFFPNGKLYVAKRYQYSIGSDKKVVYNAQIIANNDSLGKVLVADSNGYFIGYDEKFKTISEEGKIVNGKKDGVWKGEAFAGVNFVETYKVGELIAGASTGKDGDVVNYTGSRFVQPAFPGGLEAFGRYLGRTIRYPEEDRAKNITGKVMVRFVVEKDGHVTEVKALNTVSHNIDTEAVRVITLSPKWIPGSMYGRNVRVAYTVPINFTLGPL